MRSATSITFQITHQVLESAGLLSGSLRLRAKNQRTLGNEISVICLGVESSSL